MTEVSFITINYNSSAYTIKLIESIQQQTTVSYEIIVIDNNSSSKDKKHISKYCQKENINFIQNERNCGFACANMIGAKHAKGKYLFFINNDTLLLNDTAKFLKQYLEEHDDIALATAKIYDDNHLFHSSYKLFPSLMKELFGNSITRLLKKFPSNKVELSSPSAVEVVSGSCMFFKNTIFKAINGFDTNFFLYCEEEDISKRVWKEGYKVYFIPEANIYHKGGGSSSQNFELLKEYYISYTYLIFKHFNKFTAIILYLLMGIKILRRSIKKPLYRELIPFLFKGFSREYSLKVKYEN
jgi:GT2 family glycosyltransferase